MYKPSGFQPRGDVRLCVCCGDLCLLVPFCFVPCLVVCRFLFICLLLVLGLYFIMIRFCMFWHKASKFDLLLFPVHFFLCFFLSIFTCPTSCNCNMSFAPLVGADTYSLYWHWRRHCSGCKTEMKKQIPQPGTFQTGNQGACCCQWRGLLFWNWFCAFCEEVKLLRTNVLVKLS